ncbi:MAG: PIN domain-containing protein [Verrucomicrobiaceae bacterium]|nr:MAG: PIN domain-containing protein [Verrucomicrobiaceae bacterium]
MSASWFLDTNILLYAYDIDAGAKREIALRRVEEAFLHPDQTSISVQVLQEFHVNFVKAGHSTDEAAMILSDFSVWRVVDNTWTLFKKGLELQSRWQLSLWDAMILAAARHAGSTELLSEDFSAGQDYGGIRVLNPFLHP